MTDDINTEDEMVLAAEYALGLLSLAEESAIEDLLVVDPELRDHYAEWIESFANLTDDVAPVAPPAGLKERVNEALFGPLKPNNPYFQGLVFHGLGL
ncbi:MAG: hypothetical protein QNK98_09530 [Yoonia sp.]